MKRIPRLTQRFLNRRRALGADRGPSARTVAEAIGDLARRDLPLPDDFETLIPPVLTVHAHRVRGENLWILYDFDQQTVTMITLTANSPIPLDT